MQLSEHFSLAEAIDSSTAIRMGIDNIPTDEQISNMKIAAAGMEQIRTVLAHPINTNSWLRVEALEKILANKDYISWCGIHKHTIDDASWDIYFARKGHPKGFAIDFTCPAFGTPAEIVAKLKDSGIKFDQLLMEGTWVHVSFDPQMRNQVEVVTFVNDTPSYTKVS